MNHFLRRATIVFALIWLPCGVQAAQVSGEWQFELRDYCGGLGFDKRLIIEQRGPMLKFVLEDPSGELWLEGRGVSLGSE